MRLPSALLAAAGLVAAALAATPVAVAATSNDATQFAVTAGTLSFSSAADVPNLPALALNGQSQTLNATMNDLGIEDATGTSAGWNVTVNGDDGSGRSAVFKQYCPDVSCGTDSGPGYVAGGAALAASSLSLDSTSAGFTGLNGSTGTVPTLGCGSGCTIDASPGSPVKIASAALNGGLGSWQTNGFTSTSLALSAPTTLRALQANEVYSVDLLWTLNSGP